MKRYCDITCQRKSIHEATSQESQVQEAKAKADQAVAIAEYVDEKLHEAIDQTRE